MDSISTHKKTIVFISESIENISVSWIAKETYRLTSSYKFTETFELAEPSKSFEVYIKAKLKKIALKQKFHPTNGTQEEIILH